MGKIWWCWLVLAGCADGGASNEMARARVALPDAGVDAIVDAHARSDVALLPDATTNVCAPGTSEACYAGEPRLAGVGACARGTRSCEGGGEFGTWSACTGSVLPRDEICGDGVDQDCSGTPDDGPRCACELDAVRACYSGPEATQDVGICLGGTQLCERVEGTLRWGDCLDQVLPRAEVCGNGLDDDCDGTTDVGPGCECTVRTTRECYSGPRSEVGVGVCHAGTQQCVAGGRWAACEGERGPTAEVCHNGIDDDCNGEVDDGCPEIVEVPINIAGDCVVASCPPEAPYPVGCMITLYGGDERGCVASTPTFSAVYFQEGDACGAGLVEGVLRCATTPSATPLDATSCPINKPVRYYPPTYAGCPPTRG